MNRAKFVFAFFLAFVITTSVCVIPSRAQDQQNPNVSSGLMRGYRTGYSDGFQAGVTDLGSGATAQKVNVIEQGLLGARDVRHLVKGHAQFVVGAAVFNLEIARAHTHDVRECREGAQ